MTYEEKWQALKEKLDGADKAIYQVIDEKSKVFHEFDVSTEKLVLEAKAEGLRNAKAYMAELEGM